MATDSDQWGYPLVLLSSILAFLVIMLGGASIFEFFTFSRLDVKSKLAFAPGEVWNGDNATNAVVAFVLVIATVVFLIVGVVLLLVLYKRVFGDGTSKSKLWFQLCTIIFWAVSAICAIVALSLFAVEQSNAVENTVDENYYFLQTATTGTLVALLVVATVLGAVTTCLCMSPEKRSKSSTSAIDPVDAGLPDALDSKSRKSSGRSYRRM